MKILTKYPKPVSSIDFQRLKTITKVMLRIIDKATTKEMRRIAKGAELVWTPESELSMLKSRRYALIIRKKKTTVQMMVNIDESGSLVSFWSLFLKNYCNDQIESALNKNKHKEVKSCESHP